MNCVRVRTVAWLVLLGGLGGMAGVLQAEDKPCPNQKVEFNANSPPCSGGYTFLPGNSSCSDVEGDPGNCIDSKVKHGGTQSQSGYAYNKGTQRIIVGSTVCVIYSNCVYLADEQVCTISPNGSTTLPQSTYTTENCTDRQKELDPN